MSRSQGLEVFLYRAGFFFGGVEMADNKRSFLLYADVHFTVKQLTDEQAGKLFKIILSYVNDENPEVDDLLIKIAFEPIKQSLKRDLRKYELIREKRSLAGKASADKRQQVSTSVERNEQVLTHSTVNVNDNVSVNVNDININKEELLKKREQDFIELVNTYSNIYSVSMLKAFCNYWTEPNKSKTKMRFELEKTFEIGRRLAKWSSNDKSFNKTTPQNEPNYYKPLPKP